MKYLRSVVAHQGSCLPVTAASLQTEEIGAHSRISRAKKHRPTQSKALLVESYAQWAQRLHHLTGCQCPAEFQPQSQSSALTYTANGASSLQSSATPYGLIALPRWCFPLLLNHLACCSPACQATPNIDPPA